MLNLAIDIGKVLRLVRFKTSLSLLFFTRYFFLKKFNRKFVIGNHHLKICDALERVLRGECRRLMINIAPRYGKTELAVKNFIAHGLGLNPSARFIHLSYSDDLALDNSEEVRDLIAQDFYQEVYPEVEIKKDSKAKKKWYTTAGGGVYATAAAGQVTGFGAGKVDEEPEEDEEAVIDEFLDGIQQAELDETGIERKMRFGGALVIDDPIKPEDADSEAIRERVNGRWDSTISSRVNSRNTPIIIIMQRLHERDLCGHLLERDGKIEDGGEWEVVSLPSLFVNENGDLEALWPFKHTVEELQALQKKNTVVFERQHLQDPKPLKGLLFAEKELQFYNPATVDVEKLAEFKFFTTDPADDGGDDLSAPFGYLIGDKIYIDHVIYNTDGADVNEHGLFDQIISRGMNAGVIEGNGAWKLFAVAVRNKVQEVTEDCEIRIIKNSTNKHTRILAMASFIRNHMVFRSDFKEHDQYNKFMRCLFGYMKVQEGTSRSKHDDAPDSLAEMAKYFQSTFAHLF